MTRDVEIEAPACDVAHRASAGARVRPLRVGISTRALFDLEVEHDVFRTDGVDAYLRLQREREDHPLAKGAGFEVVARLLALNTPEQDPLVEVVLLSRNAPDLSLRTFMSIDRHGLAIRTGSFTSGRPLAPFIPAWGLDLFLSNEPADVEAVIAAGVAAGTLGQIPSQAPVAADGEVRIALDGDAVVFSAESDQIYARDGLEAFLRHEVENARRPMAGGPFGAFLKQLSDLRRRCLQIHGVDRIRIAIVTSRSAPAHARFIHTLRAWDAKVDEAHFVGAGSKAPLLAAFGAHIFFDDRAGHILAASAVVPAAHVP